MSVVCLQEVKFILKQVLPLCHFFWSLTRLVLHVPVTVNKPLPKTFLYGLVLKMFIGLRQEDVPTSSQASVSISMSLLCVLAHFSVTPSSAGCVVSSLLASSLCFCVSSCLSLSLSYTLHHFSVSVTTLSDSVYSLS